MSEPRKCSIKLLSGRVDIIVPARPRFFRKALPEKTLSFTWQEVSNVFAFKRDCYAVDLLCMTFELNRETTIELNEEMIGWKELIEEIPKQLPGASPQDEWFQKVAFPPFALCWTEIYSRITDTQNSEITVTQ